MLFNHLLKMKLLLNKLMNKYRNDADIIENKYLMGTAFKDALNIFFNDKEEEDF